MKIIAFPFAGGNKFSFKQFFSVSCNATVLDYPGRGLRIKENLIENIDELTSNLISGVRDQINSCDDYVIFGHSMGALVGYLICQKIEELNLKRPNKLIVGGAKSPEKFREKRISNLPDDDFWNEVTKLGGIPVGINDHPELKDFFTPILRADFKCIENYQYNIDAPKLTIPIDVFYGSDEDITQQEADAWQIETIAAVNVSKLKGDHFFMFEHKKFFNEYFKSL